MSDLWWPKGAKFKHGQRVQSREGAPWTGRVCGAYKTSVTEPGYAVESEDRPGTVKFYPESRLTPVRW